MTENKEIESNSDERVAELLKIIDPSIVDNEVKSKSTIKEPGSGTVVDNDTGEVIDLAQAMIDKNMEAIKRANEIRDRANKKCSEQYMEIKSFKLLFENATVGDVLSVPSKVLDHFNIRVYKILNRSDDKTKTHILAELISIAEPKFIAMVSDTNKAYIKIKVISCKYDNEPYSFSEAYIKYNKCNTKLTLNGGLDG